MLKNGICTTSQPASKQARALILGDLIRAFFVLWVRGTELEVIANAKHCGAWRPLKTRCFPRGFALGPHELNGVENMHYDDSKCMYY